MRAWTPVVLLAGALALSAAVPAIAYEDKGGVITDETWGPGTIHVTTTVDKQGVLTILPGTVVKFAAGTTLVGEYGILAEGSSGSPIVFTSANDDSVGEVILGSTGAPARGDWAATWWGQWHSSTFKHCTFRYGESIHFQGQDGGTTFEACDVRDMAGHALWADGRTADRFPKVTASTIADCDGVGVVGLGTIDGCTIDNCGVGVSITYGNALIRGSRLTRCGLAYPAGDGSAAAISLWYASDPDNPVIIEDNVLENNASAMQLSNQYTSSATSILVRRNTIDGCRDDGMWSYWGCSADVQDNYVAHCGGSGILSAYVLRCVVEDCGGVGIYSHAGRGRLASNTVRRCAYGVAASYAGDSGNPATIENNLVTDCDIGLYAHCPYWSGPGPGAVLRYNTVVNSGTAALWVDFGDFARMQITNNVLAFGTEVSIANGDWRAIMTGDHNVIFGFPGDPTTYVPGPHDLNVDPCFVNPAGGDYHLAPTSPAIDSASPYGVPSDLNGRLRPVDGNGDGITGYDRGCFEYWPSGDALVLNPNPVVAGQSTTATIMLEDPAPSGGITFTMEGLGVTMPAIVTVDAGSTSATFTVTTSAVTEETSVNIRATSDALVLNQTLSVWPVVGTAVTVGDARETVGAYVMLVADLRRSDTNAALGMKVVVFSVDGTVCASSATSHTGRAVVYYGIPESPGGGSYAITGAFPGDTFFSASSGTGTLTVDKIATKCYTLDRTGTITGPVTLKGYLYRLADDGVIADKPIVFSIDGTEVGSGTTNASGMAPYTWTITDGPATRTILAAFAGDGAYTSSSFSATLTAATHATKMSGLNRSGRITDYTIFKAYLYRTDSTPVVGKTITFKLDGTLVGSDATVSTGRAQVGYTIAGGAGAGVRTILAEWAGDGGYLAKSCTNTLTVTQAIPYVWVMPKTVPHGGTAGLYAYFRRLCDYQKQAGKTVSFLVDGTLVQSVVTDAIGVARYPYHTVEDVGDHTIRCEFAGDAWVEAGYGEGRLRVY